VKQRGYSRRLQRVREHYGIAAPVSAAREHTLRHARAIAGTSAPPAPPAAQLITQRDGSMIPIVTPGAGADARRGKALSWCQARAVLRARE
jgi:hypothetical protein